MTMQRTTVGERKVLTHCDLATGDVKLEVQGTGGPKVPPNKIT